MRRPAIALAFVLAVLLSGCLPYVRAKVSIPDLERAFPTIVDLGLKSYEFRRYSEGDPICEAMHYRRGAFATITNGLCGSWASDPVVDQIAFDQTATHDLATLKAALGGNLGKDQAYILIQSNPDGSVGPGSLFGADGCVTYFYSPRWSALPSSIPGEEVSTGVNPNWYQTDICQ